MKYFKQYIWASALFAVVVMFGACVTESAQNQTSLKSNSTRLEVYLNVPKANAKFASTRSMNDEDTYRVDMNASRVFLFKSGLFYKELEIDEENVEFDSFSKQYKLLFDIEGDKSTVDFVFLSNYKGERPTERQSKTNFYAAVEFPVQGAWDMETPCLVPMWGEIKGVDLKKFEGIGDAPRLEVTMIRSFAKLMIESKGSVDIKSTYVFRSNNNALVVPNLKNYNAIDRIVTKPSIPSSINYNDMESGVEAGIYSNLSFMNEGELGKGGFTLIPEQEANANDMAANLCVVVEANYQDKSYFYRIDLAKDVNGVLTYLDVLRNHQYKIIIKNIHGVGYEDMYEAATSPSAGISTEVHELDEGINETYVHDDRYFSIKNYPLVFETGLANEVQSFSYQTNWDVDNLEELQQSLQWKSESDKFEATINTRNRQIDVKTLEDNYTTDIKDALLIPVGNYTFEVLVTQNVASQGEEIYWADCESITVHGDYRVGEELTTDNYISMTLVSNRVITSGGYEVYTPAENEIFFSSYGDLNISTRRADGKFEQVVKLQGVSTPTKAGEASFHIYSNKNESISCDVVVNVEGKAPVTPTVDGKWIVGIDTGSNGYVLEGYNGRRFRESIYNFGLTPNATVQTESLKDISIEEAVAGKAGYTFIPVSNQNYGRILSGELGRVPDVVIVGGYIRMEQPFGQALARYMDNGGYVMLMMNNGQDVKQFLDLVGGFDIKGVNGSGNVFKIDATSGDDIVDGPFGNLNGSYWTASGESVGLGNQGGYFNSYSDAMPLTSTNPQDNRGAGIIMGKENYGKNLFFVGNPFFLGDSYFGIDGFGRPTHVNYGDKRIGNSILFANALIKALQQSNLRSR